MPAQHEDDIRFDQIGAQISRPARDQYAGDKHTPGCACAWCRVERDNEQIGDRERELLLAVAVAAEAFCAETIGKEITENGRALQVALAEWRKL